MLPNMSGVGPTPGPTLRIARICRGLTLRQVAAGAGLPLWRLNAAERGKATLRPDEFARAWNFLSTDAPSDALVRREIKEIVEDVVRDQEDAVVRKVVRLCREPGDGSARTP
jgi:hypothetical protein